jgi:hypothetical protein
MTKTGFSYFSFCFWHLHIKSIPLPFFLLHAQAQNKNSIDVNHTIRDFIVINKDFVLYVRLS